MVWETTAYTHTHPWGNVLESGRELVPGGGAVESVRRVRHTHIPPRSPGQFPFYPGPSEQEGRGKEAPTLEQPDLVGGSPGHQKMLAFSSTDQPEREHAGSKQAGADCGLWGARAPHHAI